MGIMGGGGVRRVANRGASGPPKLMICPLGQGRRRREVVYRKLGRPTHELHIFCGGLEVDPAGSPKY